MVPGTLAATAQAQSPAWVILGREGKDNEGDGLIDEDPPGGYDPNRNYGSDWQQGLLSDRARCFAGSVSSVSFA